MFILTSWLKILFVFKTYFSWHYKTRNSGNRRISRIIRGHRRTTHTQFTLHILHVYTYTYNECNFARLMSKSDPACGSRRCSGARRDVRTVLVIWHVKTAQSCAGRCVSRSLELSHIYAVLGGTDTTNSSMSGDSGARETHGIVAVTSHSRCVAPMKLTSLGLRLSYFRYATSCLLSPYTSAAKAAPTP